MKKIILALALISFPLISNAEQATSSSLSQEQQDGLALAFKDYAGIAGAWFLQEKCKFLDESGQKEFEQTVASNTIFMRETMKFDQNLLNKLQASARQTAYSDKYPCDNPDTKGLFGAAVIKSKKLAGLSQALADYNAGNKTTPIESLKEPYIEKYLDITKGWYLEGKCKILKDDERQEFDKHYAKSTEGMIKVLQTKQSTIDDILQTTSDKYSSDDYPCDDPIVISHIEQGAVKAQEFQQEIKDLAMKLIEIIDEREKLKSQPN